MSGEYPPPITIRDNCAVPEWTHNQAEPDSEAVALAHVACSTISVVCCAFVLLVSNRVDELRRFPNNMLLWKTACDLVTSGCIVAINGAILANAALTRQGANGTRTSVEVGAEVCNFGIVSFFFAASLLASPGWFFAITFNLNRSIHDPFTRPQARLRNSAQFSARFGANSLRSPHLPPGRSQSRMKKLHLWVWGTAAVAGVVAAALNEYRPNHHLCYVCAEFAPSLSCDAVLDAHEGRVVEAEQLALVHRLALVHDRWVLLRDGVAFRSSRAVRRVAINGVGIRIGAAVCRNT
jgi:hypothetical protein